MALPLIDVHVAPESTDKYGPVWVAAATSPGTEGLNRRSKTTGAELHEPPAAIPELLLAKLAPPSALRYTPPHDSELENAASTILGFVGSTAIAWGQPHGLGERLALV